MIGWQWHQLDDTQIIGTSFHKYFAVVKMSHLRTLSFWKLSIGHTLKIVLIAQFILPADDRKFLHNFPAASTHRRHEYSYCLCEHLPACDIILLHALATLVARPLTHRNDRAPQVLSENMKEEDPMGNQLTQVHLEKLLLNGSSSLLAPAHLGGPGKRVVKRLWCGYVPTN